MHNLHNLPPLLELPIEGQLQVILSGIELQPGLEEHQNVLLQTRWWGDDTACDFRVDGCSRSARLSFGVCCNDQSFRQYLQDAQKLVFAVSIEEHPPITSKNCRTTLFEGEQRHESAMTTAVTSPTKCVAKADSPVQQLEKGLPVPPHLLGTPRHRLLEMKRTRWCPGDEVGECTLDNLKLNPRGELVHQCYITNRFTDVVGLINVTMIYTHDLTLVEPVASEYKDDTSADCSSVLHSELYSEMVNKENMITANEWNNECSRGNKLPPILIYKTQINDSFSHMRVLRTNQYANECEGNVSVNHSNSFSGTLLPVIDTTLPDFSKLSMDSNIQDNYTQAKIFNLPPHFTNMTERTPLQINTFGFSNSSIPLQLGISKITSGGQATHLTEDRLSAHTDTFPHNLVTEDAQVPDRLSLPAVNISTNSQRGPNLAPSTSDRVQPQGSYDQTTATNDSKFSQAISLGRPPDPPHCPGFTSEDQFEAASDGNSDRVQHTPSQDSLEDTLSDESVVNYLRQLDPNALIECGALRIDDLPKFLKIIRDNTLDDIGERTSPHQTSSNVSTALIHSQSLMSSSADIHPKLTAATLNFDTLPQSSSNARLAHPSLIQTGSLYHVTPAQSTHLNGITGSVSTGQAGVFSTRHVASPPRRCVIPTTSEYHKEKGPGAAGTLLPAVQRENSERSFSMRASEKRLSGGEQSEYSGISLPSGVWPLAPDHQEKNCKLVHGRRPSEQILHGIEQPNFKLPSYRYKAIGPDGKELVMHSDHLMRLTNSKHTQENYRPINCNSQRMTAEGELSNKKEHQLGKERLLSESVGAQNIHGEDKSYYSRPNTIVLNNNDDEDSISVASDETYTTSSINPNIGGTEREEGVSSPGSLLVAEVGTLAVQGASIGDHAVNKFNLKGVRDRSNVCLLTTLTVILPSATNPVGDSGLPPRDQQSGPARFREPASGNRLEEDGVAEGSDDPQRQSVTLVSRRLQDGKVHYGTVEVFSLSGLTAPEHLQRTSLEIRVYKRVLGQRESELLCGAQLSLWDVYRLFYGHVTIPLAPANAAVTVTRHGAVDTTLAVVDNNSNVLRSVPTKGVRVSPAPKSPAKVRGVAQNVRSTRFGDNRLQREERGTAAARRRSDERKPVSGEITLFLKLFLNEQYVDELRHSIIEDPSVINSFICERDYPKVVSDEAIIEDSVGVLTIPSNYSLVDSVGVLTIPPNYSLSHNRTKVNDGGKENINPFWDMKEPSCEWHSSAANGKILNTNLAPPPMGYLVTKDGKENVGKTSRPASFVPIVSDIPQPIHKNPVEPRENPQMGFSDENRVSLASLITDRPWNRSNLPNGGCEGRQTLPFSNLSSHRSDSSRHSSKLPESVDDNPLHQPHQSTSHEYNLSKPDLHFVQSSVNNPSVSFIQTLSQKFHQNNEYMIRIHIEILEARDLRVMSESVRPYGGQQLLETPSAYVRGTFFGTDIVTRVHSTTSHPKWNFADDIIVSSSDVNNARACVVLRVYHQPDHIIATPSELYRPPSHPLIGCLALRPPTPFWPGQVSLCGWYPLLDIRGQMAGHVKLSLTIVESLLNETCAVQYQQMTSANTAELVKPLQTTVSLQGNSNEIRDHTASRQDHFSSHNHGLSFGMVDPETGVMSQRSVIDSSRLPLTADTKHSSHHKDSSSRFQREEATGFVGTASVGCLVPMSYPQLSSANNSSLRTTSTRQLDDSLLRRDQSRFNKENRISPTNRYHRTSNCVASAETAIKEDAGTCMSSCVKSLMNTLHQETNYSVRSTPQNRDVSTSSSSTRFLSNDIPITDPRSYHSVHRIPPLLLFHEDVPTRDTALFQEVTQILPPPPIYADDSISQNSVVDSFDPSLVEPLINRRDVVSPPDHLYEGSNSFSKVKCSATTVPVSQDNPLSINPSICDGPFEIPCRVDSTNGLRSNSPFANVILSDNSKEITSHNRRSKTDLLISYSQLYPNKMRRPFQPSPEAAFPSPLSSSNAPALSWSEHCSVISSGSNASISHGNDRTFGSNVEVTWTNCRSVSSLLESNRLVPMNAQVNSCLKTVDSPRGFSKRVKFLDEHVSIYDEEGNLEEDSESSALLLHRVDRKSEQLQLGFKVSEGLQIEDLEEGNKYEKGQPRYMNDIRNFEICSSKLTPVSAEWSSEKTTNDGLVKEICDRVSSCVGGNLPEREPLTASHTSSVPVARPDISDLLQTLSWMNLTKDSDSPCTSYIDNKKQCSEGNAIRSGSGTVLSGVCERVSSTNLHTQKGPGASRSRLADVAFPATTNSAPYLGSEPHCVAVVSSDRRPEKLQAYKEKSTRQPRYRIAANFSKPK